MAAVEYRASAKSSEAVPMTVSETASPLRNSRGLEASGVASQVLTLGAYPSAATLYLMVAANCGDRTHFDAELEEKLSKSSSADGDASTTRMQRL